MEHLVSVVIPVYNSEKYLSKCIESFLNQSYKEYELIIIDDGSRDASYSIMQQYKDAYPDKIRIFTQDNSGVAITRNRGIEYSKGMYVMFADNDDFVELDYIEKMVSAIVSDNLDMVVCSSRKVDESGEELYQQVLTDDEWSKFRMITPWGRIIRKSFLIDNNIKFGDFKLGEDSFFTVTAYNHTNKIKNLSYIGYNWVQHPTSVSNTIQKRGIVSPIPFLEALIERNKELKYIPKDLFVYFVVKFVVWNLYYICDDVDKNELKKYGYNYFAWLKKVYPDYKKNRQISLLKPKGEEGMIRCLVWLMAKSPDFIRMFVLKFIRIIKKRANSKGQFKLK